MTEFDRKIIDNFPGKIVRKDLTSLMKSGVNVPTFVLEYLLGMYCSTDDEDAIAEGMNRISRILSENYVRPEQSEYIKSRIRELGQYNLIDKIKVELDARADKYIAHFTNLNISEFEISSDIVVHNDKLLMGGVWCMVKIEYVGLPEEEEEDKWETDVYGNQKIMKKVRTKKERSKYNSVFEITSLRPIQMPSLNLDEMLEARKNFTKDEWISLLLRSAGYEPTQLQEKQKLHYLLRLVPFIQRNYNLVELGPRGTGKSHIYSELSPYSILMSSGHTTVANLFYSMRSSLVGLVGNWDCIAFDEVGGINQSSDDMIQIMKNYMANGTFARGSEAYGADASFAFEGNTFRSVSEMMRTTNLFDPFPDKFNNDSAFFDRIHAYLPGWETPKLRSELFTKGYGLISDCLSEFCHVMRKYDFTDSFGEYFTLNSNYNTRDDTAVRRTFSGMAKLVYPDGTMSKEETRELLEYSIECRRRVKEQLRKMNPSEYSDVALGYTDNETGEEFVVGLPEVSDGTLVFDGLEQPGYVYGIGRSLDGKIGLYRLENKLIDGSGEFKFKNIEGLSWSNKTVRDSLQASFNYFSENAWKLVNQTPKAFDYLLYFNDLQGRGVSDGISVAEAVGLFSALANRPLLPAVVIYGRVMMSGSIMPAVGELDEIFSDASVAGAKQLLLPEVCREKYNRTNVRVRNGLSAVFYSTPLDAAKKAMGIM